MGSYSLKALLDNMLARDKDLQNVLDFEESVYELPAALRGEQEDTETLRTIPQSGLAAFERSSATESPENATSLNTPVVDFKAGPKVGKRPKKRTKGRQKAKGEKPNVEPFEAKIVLPDGDEVFVFDNDWTFMRKEEGPDVVQTDLTQEDDLQHPARNEQPNTLPCLYTCCIDCMRTDRFKSTGQHIPTTLVPDGDELEAGYLMIVRWSCPLPPVRCYSPGFRSDKSNYDHREGFTNTGLSPKFIAGCQSYRLACLDAGRELRIITYKSKLAYLDISEVKEAFGPGGTVVNLVPDQVDTGDRNKMVNPEFKLGLF